MRKKLAGHDGQGDVATCGRCTDVHIRWDNLMLSLSRERFEAFSQMITQARGSLAQDPTAPQSTTAPGKWLQ